MKMIESIFDVISLEQMDMAFVGALIWLFNKMVVKGERSPIPDEMIPWISVGLGFLAAFVVHITKGAGFTGIEIGQLLKSGVVYGIVAIVIQGMIKKGLFDLTSVIVTKIRK